MMKRQARTPARGTPRPKSREESARCPACGHHAATPHAREAHIRDGCNRTTRGGTR